MYRARLRPRRRDSRLVTFAVVATATMLLLGNIGSAGAARRRPDQFPKFEARSLDGSGSNSSHREWASAGTPYLRVAPANYADRSGSMVAGPNARVISNRIFNDVGQNLFSETGESQWGWTWGQFLDHDLGLRNETPGESAPIAFDTADPFESFANDFGALGFSRTPAAPGTAATSRRSARTRQQINTISSVIDASNVYGVTAPAARVAARGTDRFESREQLGELDVAGRLPADGHGARRRVVARRRWTSWAR